MTSTKPAPKPTDVRLIVKSVNMKDLKIYIHSDAELQMHRVIVQEMLLGYSEASPSNTLTEIGDWVPFSEIAYCVIQQWNYPTLTFMHAAPGFNHPLFRTSRVQVSMGI